MMASELHDDYTIHIRRDNDSVPYGFPHGYARKAFGVSIQAQEFCQSLLFNGF